MSPLSHRDRVFAVLNHETPDRLPVDLGGCPASGINLYAYKRLKDYLGLPGPMRVQAERRTGRARCGSAAGLARCGADSR